MPRTSGELVEAQNLKTFLQTCPDAWFSVLVTVHTFIKADAAVHGPSSPECVHILVCGSSFLSVCTAAERMI